MCLIFSLRWNPVYFDFKASVFFFMSLDTKILFNGLKNKNIASQTYPNGADKSYFSFWASDMPQPYLGYQAAFCPFIGQFTAFWRHCCRQLLALCQQALRLEMGFGAKTSTKNRRWQRPFTPWAVRRFFYVYYVFNVFNVLLCFKTCF